MKNQKNWITLFRFFICCSLFCFFFVFFTFCSCKFHKPDLRQNSVSKPRKYVLNHYKSSDTSEFQTFRRLYWVRWWHGLLVRGKNHPQVLVLSLHDFRKVPRKVATKNCLTWLLRNLFKNNSLQQTDSVCRNCWIDSAFSFLPNTAQKFFLEFIFAHSFQLSWYFSTTNNL